NFAALSQLHWKVEPSSANYRTRWSAVRCRRPAFGGKACAWKQQGQNTNISFSAQARSSTLPFRFPGECDPTGQLLTAMWTLPGGAGGASETSGCLSQMV